MWYLKPIFDVIEMRWWYSESIYRYAGIVDHQVFITADTTQLYSARLPFDTLGCGVILDDPGQTLD